MCVCAYVYIYTYTSFPGGSISKDSACNAGDCNTGDLGLILGSRSSSGKGNGNPFQYFCLGNPMNRGAWWAIVHRVTQSQTWLSDKTTTTIYTYTDTHIHKHTHIKFDNMWDYDFCLWETEELPELLRQLRDVPKETACNVGDLGSILGSGRSSGEGNGYPLQYSCLKNPMNRGAWWATVQRVAKSQTWLSD